MYNVYRAEVGKIFKSLFRPSSASGQYCARRIPPAELREDEGGLGARLFHRAGLESRVVLHIHVRMGRVAGCWLVVGTMRVCFLQLEEVARALVRVQWLLLLLLLPLLLLKARIVRGMSSQAVRNRRHGTARGSQPSLDLPRGEEVGKDGAQGRVLGLDSTGGLLHLHGGADSPAFVLAEAGLEVLHVVLASGPGPSLVFAVLHDRGFRLELVSHTVSCFPSLKIAMLCVHVYGCRSGRDGEAVGGLMRTLRGSRNWLHRRRVRVPLCLLSLDD